MAFSQVQNKTQTTNGSTTNVITPTSALTVNNLVVIGIKANLGTVVSATDNASTPNTYVISSASAFSDGSYLYLIYGVQVTGGATTVTITLSASINSRATLGEYSGGMTTNATVFDKSSTGTGTGTALSVSSFTPTIDGELVVEVAGNINGTNTYTAGTNYTLGGATGVIAEEYRLSSSGAETAPLTYGTSAEWRTIAAAFIPKINFDAASNSGYQATASSYNWSHTCTGPNRYLVVGVSMLSVVGSSVTGITYNSVAMTFLGAIASVSGAVRSELWGLAAPATGSNSIAVTLSTGLISAACAMSFIQVNQSSSTEGLNTATATNVGAADATVDVTTVANNDLVVDQVATDDTAITVGAGQTQRNNVTGVGGSGADSTEGPKNPAGSVTMSWANIGALATWSIVAIALRDINAASLVTTRLKSLLGVGI